MIKKLYPAYLLLMLISLAAFAASRPALAGETPGATTTVWPPKTYDHYVFFYNLLPADTEDLFNDEIPGLWSDAEKQDARDIAARMEAAFNDWIAQYPELKENRPVDPGVLEFYRHNHLEKNWQYAYFEPHEHAGVLRLVFIYLYKDDAELAGELQQALELPGVPQSEVDRPGDPRMTPEWQEFNDNYVGYRIEWEMFSDEKMQLCIDQGRTPDVFTEEEQAFAREVLGSIRDGWREWMAAHPELAKLECMGFPAHHAQVQHLAGVPISFWVQLGVEDEALLSDVLAALDIPGAPKPEIMNIREEREARSKQLDSNDS